MKKIILFVSILIIFITSCNKNNDSGNTSIIPSNLSVNAVVATDNSGNVSFTATATNAIVFTYDLGNGVTQLSATGTLDYKYFASGVYTVTVVAKSSTGQTISKSILINVTLAMSLVWSDEFNVAGAPDASKWGYDIGAGGWGNNELQYYTNRTDNAVVSGGTLKINLKSESFSGSPYTSARLLSKGKYSFKYGRVEAMAKLPAGGGTWPAIWMLGNNISTTPWPACGEIDIMEHVGNQLNKIHGSIHEPAHFGGNSITGTTIISNATTAFHKYSMEWNETSIKFYVDDAIYFSTSNNNTLPFNQNFFLILNVAMGGNFGGAVDPAFNSASMEIDYIRVYQ